MTHTRLPLITVFGLGHMRPASGTWGSMPPVVIAGILWLVGCSPAATKPVSPLLFDAVKSMGSGVAEGVYYGVLSILFLVFCWACVRFGDQAEAMFGHDPKECVADETAGQCLSLLVLPAAAFMTWKSAVLWLGVSFVLFRIFDIVKPWPARQIQKAPGGWGILLDDLFAGTYAAIVVGVASRML